MRYTRLRADIVAGQGDRHTSSTFRAVHGIVGLPSRRPEAGSPSKGLLRLRHSSDAAWCQYRSKT
jgi:hypothetical protein